MADAGVKMGLPRDLAYKLAAQTMVGSGQMVLQTGTHPAVLKDEVCSPGGSTITGKIFTDHILFQEKMLNSNSTLQLLINWNRVVSGLA